MSRITLLLLSALIVSGCGSVLREKTPEEQEQVPIATNEEEATYVLEETGKNIVFGEQLGDIGAAVLFFPYGLYKIGQAAANLAGYKLDAKEALDSESKKAVEGVYRSVVSVPGRAASALADEEYRGEGKKIDLKAYREEGD